MTKIIELAHKLGVEIAESDEMKALEAAKKTYDEDTELQELIREYETERFLLRQEMSKEVDDVDKDTMMKIKSRVEELSGVIASNPNFILFTNAQKCVNDIMDSINAEIKFCITGERPVECTHDCSTCGGCSH